MQRERRPQTHKANVLIDLDGEVAIQQIPSTSRSAVNLAIDTLFPQRNSAAAHIKVEVDVYD